MRALALFQRSVVRAPAQEIFHSKKTSGPSCTCGMLHLSSVPIWCGLEKKTLCQRLKSENSINRALRCPMIVS